MLFECGHFGHESIVSWKDCHMHRVSLSRHACVGFYWKKHCTDLAVLPIRLYVGTKLPQVEDASDWNGCTFGELKSFTAASKGLEQFTLLFTTGHQPWMIQIAAEHISVGINWLRHIVTAYFCLRNTLTYLLTYWVLYSSQLSRERNELNLFLNLMWSPLWNRSWQPCISLVNLLFVSSQSW